MSAGPTYIGFDGQIHPLITPCNRQDAAGGGSDMLNHILADVHEVLLRLDRFEREARPLLDAYKRTNGGTIGLLKARKGMRNGG